MQSNNQQPTTRSNAPRELLIDRFLQSLDDLREVTATDSLPPALYAVDLTLVQLRAILGLAALGPTPIGRLAATLGVGQSAASLLVSRLVRKGLVQRAEDPADRRQTLAALSQGGRDLVMELVNAGRNLLRPHLERLTDNDLGALTHGMQALARLARAAAAPADSQGNSR